MIYDSLDTLLADGTAYDVIYADPPWDFSNSNVQYGNGGKANVKDHYATMSQAQLEALPVRSIAADPSVLLLWTTDAHLEHALALGRAWGFKYATVQFAWCKLTSTGKVARVLGPWGLKSVEQCLLFTRGKAHSGLLTSRKALQYHALPREEHSKKPAAIRCEVDRMFIGARKMELFGREECRGWDVFGNQVCAELAR